MITIQGFSTKLSKKEAFYASNFFVSKLLLPNQIEKVDITIKFFKFDNHECAHVLQISNIDYEIEINNEYGKMSQIKSIAHELAHVKQYVNRQLKDHHKGIYWHKDIFKYDDIGYWMMPHEIEAYGLEKCLYELYMEHKRRVRPSFS